MITSGKNMVLTEEQKQVIQNNAQEAYGKFLSALGYSWETDPNMKDTPKRVAKMFVREIGKGAYDAPPKITVFENVDKYSGMVFSGNINVKSFCSHHIMPFFGKAHVAYIPDPNGKICGLSKLNRIVDFFSRRPQVQENLTQQIADYLDQLLPGNLGVAVYIEASHTCVSMRGVNQNSNMKTAVLTGAFKENADTRSEFYDFVKGSK